MQELVYGWSADRALRALVYPPAGPDAGAGGQGEGGSVAGAVIDVHGGAWYRGDKQAGQHYCEELARRGWLVLAPDFHDAALGGQHPDACRDVTACIRYLRSHAGHFGLDPAQINLLGSSSGGHLAMLCAVLGDSPRFAGTLINTQPPGATPAYAACTLSASVKGVTALWPVADPLYRYHYAQKHQRAELVAGHDAYFGSQAEMQRAAIAHVIRSGEAQRLPPLFVVQAGSDNNVPPEMLERLVQTWQAHSGVVQSAFYPGMPHGFACRARRSDRALHS